jgi:hypothetical protein
MHRQDSKENTMRQHSTTLVHATPASALVFGDGTQTVSAFDTAGGPTSGSGERIVHLQRLRAHQASGFGYDLAGPNCLLRWAGIPAGHAGPVDLVIHFHGYKGHDQMRLRDKAAASGLDLGAPGVGRPTLGVVPHGHAFRSRMAGTDGFDFPAIDTKAELDAFIDEVLAAFGRDGGPRATRGRVILTGHSGGGAALARLMQSAGPVSGPGNIDAFQFFDATYGGQSTLTASGGWIDTVISRDAAALRLMTDDSARLRHLRGNGGHLRIAFIDGSPTAEIAKAADRFMRQRIDANTQDAGLRAMLRKFYRAQKVAHPDRIGHGAVPRACGGRLLADPGHDLAPEMAELPAPVARAHAAEAGAGHEDEWDHDGAEAAAWDGEAFDVTVPVLVPPARAADAPTGSAFIASLGERKGVERENRIFEQIRAGNMPPSLLSFSTVRTSAADRAGQRHEIEFYVTPDVLAIGTESDQVRIPTDPVTAQRIADRFECLLPTARMVEQLYQAAPTKLAFIPGQYAGTPRAHLQDASSSYAWHSRQIDGQLRRPPTILTAGHKKELVISNGYLRASRDKATGTMGPARAKLAFYGAYTAAGAPIQAPRNGTTVMRGYPSFAHEPVFVDYSHGVRLVWPTMKVDGAERRVADVLRDTNLSLLIAAEGPIAEPRYTLDRTGRTATAHAAAAGLDDPLGLDRYGGALGYGQSWDERIRTAVEGFLAGWMGIPVRIGSQALRVHPPYFMNANASSAAATRERHRIATEHRTAAPAALRALIGEGRFANERIGKSTTDKLRDLLQDADSRGLLAADATVGASPTGDRLRDFLKHYGLGIDCSGFVSQAINTLVDLFPGATAADRIAAPHSTASGSLKGGQGAFDRVTDPAQLCGGDTMWLSGHIRILAWAERRGTGICFCTAESRSSNPRDIGPSIAYWRLVPDTAAGTENFRGWRLERSNDLNAPASGWARVNTTHVYGHYRPLRRLLAAAGVTPVALDAPPLPSSSRSAPQAPPPVAGTTAPMTPATPVTATAPPRSAVTRDLTQAEIDRLAAIRLRNAADVEAFFRRGGQASFIDWYNAGLAHSTPFSARGAIGTGRVVRDRFTQFWNQVATAFDRPEITALDFAAFTAISINETGGNLWAHPERGGGGRSDARGRHAGLAYFFDRVELQPGRFKASYNHLSGGRTAGSLFDDADFIDAHGSLPGAARLAHHGGEFGGAWNGSYYPQTDFTTAEDTAVNGFIMQADFHKFRGRGVIQTTGRPSYKRCVDFVKGYRGGNTVLADFSRRWAGFTADVACTRSRTEEWDRLFEQPEMLAKGLSLHAGTRDDYRRMSTTAATLADVPAESAGNARGTTGSIYAMGRRISGSRAYGAGVYRQRVLALLHGFLTLP